ncbi:Sodium/hydrogen exchanger family-domain-containing protein [Daldinia vernicosa]|uniref:Sodium/hydrogen exchanger family-domain-containing protein n=1 Tax=Daldinia vernicosa TaxID=114800 RepID=UPI002007735C|nr:Sodium/hydrogen exchanger family-domain-containing protein [Daldinia vernicosa]KAI0846378.1 Sodium/hydrogen exchanger family-domain-containing protein [Daldinia vernicosa]
MPSLPYHEPSIIQLLTLSTFLLALNAINAVLDRALYCGLVGQVLIGVVWGAPGGNWLAAELQLAIVQLGYIGLVLLVFEGGVTTRVDAVRRNMGLSAGVAATGVAAPMAFGFAVLGALGGADAKMGFAAGAALCVTSLGTTFAVLETSGLTDTRVGTVLGTAAMMDDVLGLVLAEIVSSMGGEESMDIGNTVLRPVLVSLAFAAAVPVVCRFVLRPFVIPVVRRARTRDGDGDGETGRTGWWRWDFLDSKQVAFVVQTVLLIALVVGASFAGASVLLAAYLAGITISWWEDTLSSSDSDSLADEQRPRSHHAASSQEQQRAEPQREGSELSQTSEEPTVQAADNSSNASITSQAPASRECQQQKPEHNAHDALDIYETYYSQAVTRILKPFFFASIGFSIPISEMFSGEVIWRGVIYGILMAIGKMMCGLWLVRFPLSLSTSGLVRAFVSFFSSRYRALFSRFRHPRKANSSPPAKTTVPTEGVELEPVAVTTPQSIRDGKSEGVVDPSGEMLQRRESQAGKDSGLQETATPAKPLSLYPAAIVSSAMVARGEIGFLISAVAESNGVFRRPSDSGKEGASELFLIVTWAIVLCTIFGPICVGMLVGRVKKLEARAAKAGERGTKNVLGVWGVQ